MWSEFPEPTLGTRFRVTPQRDRADQPSQEHTGDPRFGFEVGAEASHLFGECHPQAVDIRLCLPWLGQDFVEASDLGFPLSDGRSDGGRRYSVCDRRDQIINLCAQQVALGV